MADTKTRRRNLMRESPFCNWCRRPVFEYGDDGVVYPDRATLDHVNQKSEFEGKRPGRGWTVLACWECNQRRGLEAEAARREKKTVPCAECGQLTDSRGFCRRECWEANWTRLGREILTPGQLEQRRKEYRVKKSLSRKAYLRNRAKRRERRTAAAIERASSAQALLR